MLWGLLEPYWLQRRDLRASVPDLPEGWRGARVALLSDLHVGMFLANTATVRRAVRRILRERPDLVLIAGDFVHDTARAAPRAAALLRPLVEGGLPVFAVLGNHDYAMPTRNDRRRDEVAAAVREALEGAGIRVLRNESVALAAPGREREVLHLVGIGAHTPGEDDAAAAFARVPAEEARIALMHHPATFGALPAYVAPFAVAGHTHGGQVRIPLHPVWRYLTYVKDTEVYVAGWIASAAIEGYGREGNRLYVNRGIGCSAVPLRIGCRPELTLFELERAPGRESEVRSV